MIDGGRECARACACMHVWADNFNTPLNSLIEGKDLVLNFSLKDWRCG